MRRAALYFHQGWTDIINCLPLINYYSDRYDALTLLVRRDAAPIVDYYVRELRNVTVDYYSKVDLDHKISGILPKYDGFDRVFIGGHDSMRQDQYHGCFWRRYPNDFFVERFYTSYDIDYSVRVKEFSLPRSLGLEDEIYERFVAEHGRDYVIYHEDKERGIIIDKTQFSRGSVWVDLNQKSDVMFDYMKVLANAKEIHMIDSVWAAVAYLVDAKYGMLQNISVRAHCVRNYHDMYQHPVSLPNWSII